MAPPSSCQHEQIISTFLNQILANLWHDLKLGEVSIAPFMTKSLLSNAGSEKSFENVLIFQWKCHLLQIEIEPAL